MAGWLKRKAVEKSQSNIDIILNNLAHICEQLDKEIVANGGAPVSSGQAYDLLMSQRQELYFQLNGPMSMNEVKAFVEPFLDRAPMMRLAVEATIKEYEESGR